MGGYDNIAVYLVTAPNVMGGYDNIAVYLVTAPNVMLWKLLSWPGSTQDWRSRGGFEPQYLVLYPQSNVSCARVLQTCVQQWEPN